MVALLRWSLLCSLLLFGSARAVRAESYFSLSPLTNWIDGSGGECATNECVADECAPAGRDTACGCEEDVLTPNMIGGGNTLRQPIISVGAGPGATLHQQHFTRISDNNSALPRDRVSFSWKVMHNVSTFDGLNLTPDQDRDLDEFNLRLEQAFFNNSVSAEVILPWQHTADFSTVAGTSPVENTELGNIAFGLKALLYRTDRLAVSAGVLAEAPTSEEFQLGQGAFVAQDEWFFTPYLAALVTPTDDLFMHAFASYRMPTGPESTNAGLTAIREPNILMLDGSVGYWLIKNPGGRLTGLAPTLELHYTATTEAYDPSLLITSVAYGETHNLELTAGVTALLGNRATISSGFVFPLRSNEGNLELAPGFGITQRTDRMFDWSYMLQVNIFSL